MARSLLGGFYRRGDLVIDLEIDQPIAELKHIDVRPGRRGWFEWLDLDRNSKLSRMELRTAAESFNLSPESDLKSPPIDRSVSIHFTSAVRRQQIFVELLPSADISSSTKADHASQAPAWFTASDYNRDSVLSINEFLAGDDLFQQLDADGDELVTNEEAKSFDLASKSFNRVPNGPRK